MITEAFAIRNQLLSGSDTSIEAMTERLGITKGRLASLVQLSYLAPDIVRALLDGRQPIELTPTRLFRLSKYLPHEWSEQRNFLGFCQAEFFAHNPGQEATDRVGLPAGCLHDGGNCCALFASEHREHLSLV
jgi:hypothetical protein